jgi:hypothetical protein
MFCVLRGCVQGTPLLLPGSLQLLCRGGLVPDAALLRGRLRVFN